MSSDERWAKATAAVKQIEEVESARRDPVGAQADLAALRRAAVRITGCDVDADLSVLLAALGMVPSLEERVGIVQVLRDVAGGPLSPEDTAAVLAVLSRSVPSSEGAGDAIGRARLAIETWNDAITSEGLPSEVIEVTPRALKAMGAVLRACRGAAEKREFAAMQEADELRAEVRSLTARRDDLDQALMLAAEAKDLSLTWASFVDAWSKTPPRTTCQFCGRPFARGMCEETIVGMPGVPGVLKICPSCDDALTKYRTPTIRDHERRTTLTAEEARIARGLQACAAAWEPDIRLIGNLTAREIERFASAILSRGEIPPDVRPVSASSTAGEWQCVSCHARETEAHRAWCEIEGKAGTIATRTHEPSSPTCGLPSEADRAALAIVVSGSPVRFAITTGTEVKKLDPDKRKLMAAFVDSAGLRPLLHELRHQAPRPFERTADGWRPIDPSKEAGELEPNRA
jgi:hypothetical protein